MMEPPKFDKRGTLSREWWDWRTEQYRQKCLAIALKQQRGIYDQL